ncbi:MAG: hypothetical protein OEM38_00700 [Gammaproteobacteria bacterium]|nr:hypothetical protein [Gammaproteobacteria bacterium]
MKKLILLVLIALSVSCTNEIPTTQFQEWGEYSFRLESRPPHVKPGMNEFLLIGNFKKKFRAYDLIVSYRMGPAGKWSQAIQDGNTGVYRKAMRVKNVETDVLFVYVKQNKKIKMTDEPVEDQVFQFPLNYSLPSDAKSGA